MQLCLDQHRGGFLDFEGSWRQSALLKWVFVPVQFVCLHLQKWNILSTRCGPFFRISHKYFEKENAIEVLHHWKDYYIQSNKYKWNLPSLPSLLPWNFLSFCPFLPNFCIFWVVPCPYMHQSYSLIQRDFSSGVGCYAYNMFHVSKFQGQTHFGMPK